MSFLAYAAIIALFLAGGFGLAMLIGRASRLGHGDERSKPREPLDIDTERL